MRKPYPTDLSDVQWNYIEPHLPAPKGHPRPRTHILHETLNAVSYLLKSGCQWRLLPHDFPRWPTVYWYFREWRIDGTFERINRAIHERLMVRLKRDPQPSAWKEDSQSVKTTAVGGEERGYDGGKKVKGTKRHILVDTKGFVLKAYVHRANVVDQMGIKTLLRQADGQFPRISQLWLDVVGYDIRDLKFCYGGSCGPFAERPGGGPAVRYETTYEYVGRSRFDDTDYRSDLKLIKTSQARADQGREGTCFFSYGIPLLRCEQPQDDRRS